MANYINVQLPPTTGAVMSTLIDSTYLVAEPVLSHFTSGESAPTRGQLWPRGNR